MTYLISKKEEKVNKSGQDLLRYSIELAQCLAKNGVTDGVLNSIEASYHPSHMIRFSEFSFGDHILSEANL